MRVGSYIHYTYDAAGTLLRKGYYVGEELTEIPGDEEEELTGFLLPGTHLMSVGDEEEEKELVEEEEEIPYTDVIDYCGNCVYENGTLKTILVEGGYITFDSSNQPVYHFYLKDPVFYPKTTAKYKQFIKKNTTVQRNFSIRSADHHRS